MILPPKRFQKTNNPIYDPIRTRSWFTNLHERRTQIVLLEQARKRIFEDNLTQKEAAIEFGLHVRELRDYERFVDWNPNWVKSDIREFQHILDLAYKEYCDSKASHHLSSFISRVAQFYASNPRRVLEEWEINPTFYPTGYIQKG